MPTQTTDLTVVPLLEVSAPGTYVGNWNGHLVQVPPEAIAPGGGLGIGVFAKEPLLLTKISDDPTIPVDVARSLAANLDLAVGF